MFHFGHILTCAKASYLSKTWKQLSLYPATTVQIIYVKYIQARSMDQLTDTTNLKDPGGSSLCEFPCPSTNTDCPPIYTPMVYTDLKSLRVYLWHWRSCETSRTHGHTGVLASAQVGELFLFGSAWTYRSINILLFVALGDRNPWIEPFYKKKKRRYRVVDLGIVASQWPPISTSGPGTWLLAWLAAISTACTISTSAWVWSDRPTSAGSKTGTEHRKYERIHVQASVCSGQSVRSGICISRFREVTSFDQYKVGHNLCDQNRGKDAWGDETLN